MSKTLRADQELRELNQMDEGVRRYYTQAEEQGAGDAKAGRAMVKVMMDKLIPTIEEHVGALERGEVRPQRTPVAYHFLLGMEADAVAYLTSKVVLSAAASGQAMSRTALLLANLIAENYQFEELEKAEPNLAHSMSKKAQRWSRSSTRRRIMRTASRVAGVADLTWSNGADRTVRGHGCHRAQRGDTDRGVKAEAAENYPPHPRMAKAPERTAR
jgi:hypothetical protein